MRRNTRIHAAWIGVVAGLVVAATVSQSATLLPPRPTVSSVCIYVLDCGTIVNDYPETFNLTRGEVADTSMGVMCYLIVHPKGTLLWDSGLTDRWVGRPLYENYSSKHVKVLKQNTLVGQLANIGYTPDMIDYLSLSHSHYDHSGNANTFAGSTWLVAKQERDIMFNWPAGSPPRGYEDFVLLKDSKTILITDHYDVFGDGSVIIHQAFGHTPGHCVMQVNLRNTGPVILAGDLYHYPEEMTLKRMPEREKTTGTPESRARIENLAKTLHAQIWIEHDISLFRLTHKAPAYYD
jgi:glyoxylase-like metal-dependent hydrolase (beta-lactamase superfamily II)